MSRQVHRACATALFIGAAVLSTSANPARADSIDDADAKKRGVPVAQVQAENALAAEKRKETDLQKQIADLEKKIADAKGGSSPAPAESTGPAPAAPRAAAVRTTPPPASAGSPAEPIISDAAHPHGPLYIGFVKRYLDGDWATLQKDLETKSKDIEALPKEDAADLDYIKGAVAECQPAWWDEVKKGKAVDFEAKVFSDTVKVHYTPGDKLNVTPHMDGDAFAVDASWSADNMDSRKPLGFAELGLNLPGDPGFTWAGVGSFQAWNAVGVRVPQLKYGLDKYDKAVQINKEYVSYRCDFWGTVVPAYYGTPEARRYLCFLATIGLNTDMSQYYNWNGKRLMGREVLEEWITHRDQYPSLQVGPINQLPESYTQQAGYSEYLFSDRLAMDGLMKHRLTLTEDRSLRDAIKKFALANADTNITSVSYPNGTRAPVNPAVNGPFEGGMTRYARLKIQWLNEARGYPAAKHVAAAPPAASAEGPRQSSPLYDDFVKRYLAGDWSTLAADMDAKKPEITALPAGNAADLAYIKQALAECRPAWLENIKTAKTLDFRQIVWDLDIPFSFKVAGDATFDYAAKSISVGWPTADVDSSAPLSFKDYRYNPESPLVRNAPDTTFTKADQANLTMWKAIGGAYPMASSGPDYYQAGEGVGIQFFSEPFIQYATAGYYGTPSGRRLAAFLCLMSLAEPKRDGSTARGLRPLGDAILMDLAQNKEHYKSLHVEPVDKMDERQGDVNGALEKSAEWALAEPVMRQLATATLTFEEDRRLREIFRQLAESNLGPNLQLISLPNKMSFLANADKDKALIDPRVNFINGRPIAINITGP